MSGDGSVGPTDTELLTVLRRALVGTVCERIDALHRRPAAYGASFHLEELDLDVDDGHIIRMMFKDVTQPRGAALSVKPQFLFNPEREIVVYRDVIPGIAGPPTCHCVVTHPDEKRYWLFLERVSGPQLRECGDFEAWKRAAVWLAHLHASFANRASRLAQRGSLLSMNQQYFAMWIARAQAMATDPAVLSALNHIGERYASVAERLARLPSTFIHGEFYPSNILIRDDTGAVCPVDWEMAAIGPGVIDLAALTTGWPPADVLTLTRTYQDVSRGASGGESIDELTELLDWCRLHLAVQWLGWSRNWTAPTEHRHDWFGDVRVLARRLLHADL